MKRISSQGDVRSSRGILGRQKFQGPSKQAVFIHTVKLFLEVYTVCKYILKFEILKCHHEHNMGRDSIPIHGIP